MRHEARRAEVLGKADHQEGKQSSQGQAELPAGLCLQAWTPAWLWLPAVVYLCLSAARWSHRRGHNGSEASFQFLFPEMSSFQESAGEFPHCPSGGVRELQGGHQLHSGLPKAAWGTCS